MSKPSDYTEGYASSTSVSPGGSLTFYVSSAASQYRADVYRMGWYTGMGGSLMTTLTSITGHVQTKHQDPDPATGLLRADWSPSFDITIPMNWPSGVYMVKLTDAISHNSYIPFVVRGTGTAPVVFIHSVATDEAYNNWGGESLYQGAAPALHLPHAIYVSFDRPFSEDYGAGEFFFWEYQMVRFLERNGIPLDYLTDVDVHEHPEWLLRYRAVIIAGHDEYWSWAMRSAYLKAVAAGVSLAVFGANTAYREIRFAPTAVGANRIEICYKNSFLDPEPNPELKTAEAWRDPPTNWDESQLLGVSYVPTGNLSPLPWVVKDSTHWVFRGTGLKDGSHLTGLLGYEQDQLGSLRPSETVLAASPVQTLGGHTVVANASIYRASSGAWVFDTGSVQWSWGLDWFQAPFLRGGGARPQYAPVIRTSFVSLPAQIIALNVLQAMLGSSFPAGLDPTRPVQPTPRPAPSFSPQPSPSPGSSPPD